MADRASVTVENKVHKILKDRGTNRDYIIGNPFKFEPNTALIVGPGSKDTFLPGYPTSEGSPLLESDWTGRDLVEIRSSRKYYDQD